MLTNQSNCQTYTISAGQSAYQFPVPFHDPSELSVSVRDNSSGTTTPLARGSASSAGYYTIPAQDSYLSGGVAVTLNAATLSAYAGKTLVVTRDVPLTQLLDLPRAGRINTESLEKTMDRFVMMAQQLQEQLRRTLQCPQGAPYDREAAYRFFERMANGIDGWLQQCTSAVDAAGLAVSAESQASGYMSQASGYAANALREATSALNDKVHASHYMSSAGGYMSQASGYMSSAGGYMSQASACVGQASSAGAAAAAYALESKLNVRENGVEIVFSTNTGNPSKYWEGYIRRPDGVTGPYEPHDGDAVLFVCNDSCADIADGFILNYPPLGPDDTMIFSAANVYQATFHWSVGGISHVFVPPFPRMALMVYDGDMGEWKCPEQQGLLEIMENFYHKNEINTLLRERASSSHTHSQGDVSGLSSALAGKQDVISAGSNGQVLTMVNGWMQWANPSSSVEADSALNSSSTNAVQNKAVWSALSSKAGNSHTHSQGDISGLSSALAGKQDVISAGSNGQVLTMVNGGMQWATPSSSVEADSALNSSSTNPVENQAVWSALSSKAGLSNGAVSRSLLPVAGSNSSEKGVVYVPNRGIIVSSGGLQIASATNEEIASRLGAYNPIWASQINLVVKAALTDSNHVTLSSEEQETARGVIGAVPAVHSHTIANVSGLQNALNSCVAHVNSLADVSAQWTANAAIRGTEKVYICRGENTTDQEEMLKGHIYHLVLFPEAYEYTYEDTIWEAEWVPWAGWGGTWQEVTGTVYRRTQNDDADGDYVYDEDEGTYTREDGAYQYKWLHAENDPDSQSAFAGWYLYDTTIADPYSHFQDADPGDTRICSPANPLQHLVETEIVTGIKFVFQGGYIWHAHTVTRTLTGFTIDYLWSDITPCVAGTCPFVDPADTITALQSRITALEALEMGTLTVNHTGTAPAGAQWSVDSGTTWHDFGDSLTLAPGTYTVTCKSVTGYTTPSSQSVTLTAGGTQTASVAYTAVATTATVTLTFSGTPPQGAGWTIDGNTYTSGQTATLDPGTYAITYASVAGYDSPSTPSSVTVAAGDALTLSAEYTEQQAAPSADYIVSGASNAAANGGYNLDSSKTNNGGGPVYKNANDWYLTYAYDNDDLESNRWIIVDTFFTQGDFFRYGIQSMASGTGNAVPTTGWSNNVTVTEA